jgi:hemicentin
MVKLEDSGQYTCTAENEAGIASRSMNLAVEGMSDHQGLGKLINKLELSVAPKIATERPMSLSVVIGANVRLPCEASGVPTPRILWQKGTRVITSSNGW